MAKSGAIWGIDIGQCSLKALRCSVDPDDASRVVANAFDYVEYAKILSQPEADPAALVNEALRELLKRHTLKDDQVAISVSGQSGMARFIKLPPVESKKIPDIVKYEARQQIPFSLEDVVWDYQQMAGGSMEEGFALETEVGLFAMKRDQVYRILAPFNSVDIGVDYIQLTPLAIYNFVVFDQLKDAPVPEEYDPENPPPSTVVISLGTDTTDLVVTNGYRVWQRSIPIGGNHFTRALTKEMKLTFSKAEKLKRNARKSENPKAIFQAMRSVFSDLRKEIQRSIGYFSSVNQNAKIGDVITLGNTLKMPGLQRYLAEHLEYPVRPVKSFRNLSGSSVTESPNFKNNLLSFCVSYGLCLQGLEKTSIKTNLLPREIVTERLIRAKKPWVVAAAAALLLGFTINFFSHYNVWKSADISGRTDFERTIRNSKMVTDRARRLSSEYDSALSNFEQIQQIGDSLVSNGEGRLLWLEVLKAINVSLPHDKADEKPESIAARQELHIEGLDCEWFDDVSEWYGEVAEKYGQFDQPTEEAPAANKNTSEDEYSSYDDGSSDEGPSGPGWVIQLQGYHYHNEHHQGGIMFVQRTLIRHLKDGSVRLPVGPQRQLVDVKIRELGIQYPLVVDYGSIEEEELLDPTKVWDPEEDDAEKENSSGIGNPFGDFSTENFSRRPRIKLGRFDFTVQFCWQKTPPSKRAKIIQKRLQEEDNEENQPDAKTVRSHQQTVRN